MQYIEAPKNYTNRSDLKAIFIAGGITGCPDWQSEIVKLLKQYDVALLNPRRSHFPINDPSAAKEQIKWEFEHLRKADAILFWFPKESICPIALYELGAWSMQEVPLFIGVHPEYSRRVDIEEQTILVRPDIKIVYTLADLVKKVCKDLGLSGETTHQKVAQCGIKIECESPAVTSYLNLLQSVISRMASNSASCKSWCITLVSAIAALLINKDKQHLVVIAIIPAILFAALDCYYLSMEKAFRDKYNGFIKKLHAGTVERTDLFVISPDTAIGWLQIWKSVKSISIRPFYLILILMICVIGVAAFDIKWLELVQSFFRYLHGNRP
jgi:hypothetical protein